MMSQAHQLLVVALAIAMITTTVKCTPSRVLDETGASPPAPEIKCTMCTSCQNSCNQSPPPPPPSPPPAPKKPKPSTPYCPPPPPPPNFIIIGPPGDLYPVDPHHFPSGASRIYGTCMPMLLGCGLIALVGFWRL